MGTWWSSPTTSEEQPAQVPPVPSVPPQQVPSVCPVHTQPSNIAAIDFGTTSVSLAYTTRGDKEISTLVLDEEEKHTRVCNALLVKKAASRGDKIQFGDTARTQFVKLRHADVSDHIIIYFERIKMLLNKDKAINRNTTVDSFTGEKYYIVEVIAFILKYLKDQLIGHLARGATPLKTTDFDWVITVPAIWDARGKRMMREAAYLAGLLTESGGITNLTPVSAQTLPLPKEINPDKLSLALEPEVAALYSQEVVVKKSARNPSAAVLHQRPTHYMVIDIGGGTVDITVHIERDGGIVVESIPTGNAWGGTKVNEAFSKMLQDIVSDPGFERFLQQSDDDTVYAMRSGEVNKILYVYFEQQKKLFGFGRIVKEIAVDLSRTFIRFYDEALKTGVKSMEGVSYENDILYIHKDVVESKLFGPALNGIISCILSVIEKSQFKVDTYIYYLVGGFGGCEYMHDKVMENIQNFYQMKGHPHCECTVIVPPSPNLAVAQGAVMWRKNPKIVKARPVDATYGIGTTIRFDPLQHDEHYCFYHDEDREYKCGSYFDVFIKKGALAKPNKKITTNLIPFRQSDTRATITIYSTSEEGVKYTKDKDGEDTVTKIGRLILDIPNPRNLPKSEREIEVTMDFSSTEIQAEAKYLVNGGKVKVVCDFLTDQKDLC